MSTLIKVAIVAGSWRGFVALVVSSLPDIKRYVKIAQM
jgi:hypothetical protein